MFVKPDIHSNSALIVLTVSVFLENLTIAVSKILGFLSSFSVPAMNKQMMRIELIYLHFNHNMLLVSSVNSKLYSSWRCTVYGHSTSPCFFYSYLSATIAYCIFLCCSVLYFTLLYLIVFYCSLLLSSAAVQLCKGALQIPLID